MSSTQKIHAAADPSANDVLNFAEKLSGEDKEASAPSLGLLQLIVLIRKAEAGNKTGETWTPLVENQLRYMKSAVQLINSDPMISMKFGNTLEGAMQLVGILKARASELEMEGRIDTVVKTDLEPNMQSTNFTPNPVFTARKAKYGY